MTSREAGRWGLERACGGAAVDLSVICLVYWSLLWVCRTRLERRWKVEFGEIEMRL